MSAHLILLVDDEPFITSIMKRKLVDRGHDVIVASDGEEALQLARTEQPHAIVTDLQMPHISGLELAVALRRLPETASTPIILLTGRGHYVNAEIIPRTNICQIISKPFSAREIVRAVETLLEVNKEAA
ncbi:MAG: response regulator [Phycisphaeraceae bacterium]|nr:response regulator [Phycisphaeraceae bacterium]MCW5764014.1 response regulator [Phycisphaeraceae bacterium]